MKLQYFTATILCVALSACSSSDDGDDSPSIPTDTTSTTPADTNQPAETDPDETTTTIGQPAETDPTEATSPIDQTEGTDPGEEDPIDTNPGVGNPTETGPIETNPTTPVTQPPSGGSDGQSEDQLLNQGTSESPINAWACSVPVDVLDDGSSFVFGFYGEGDGIFGILATDGAVTGGPTAYSFGASGDAALIVEFNDGTTQTVILRAPTFTDGTSFSSSINDGGDAEFTTNCRLIQFADGADGGTDTGTDTGTNTGTGTGTPAADGGNLESQLLNAGTLANPAEGWTCEGFLFGFYGAGEGRIGAGSSFNIMNYVVTGADEVEISANGTIGNLLAIQFSGADNFSTDFFDGSNTFTIDCTRFELSLSSAQADSTTTGLSALKSIRFDRNLAVKQMP